MKKNLLILTVAALSIPTTQAQVNTYAFEKSGALFPFLSASGAQVTEHSIQDDVVVPATIALPFAFNFGGTPHNQVSISENGFVWFGSALPTDIFYINPLSNTHPSSVKGIISAAGVDLHPVQTAVANTQISSAIVGQAPNRTLVIEWRATARIETLNDEVAPDIIDFQIRLNKSSQSVEIYYGRTILNPNTSSDLQVGLKTVDNDFNIRTTQNGSWNNTQSAENIQQSCVLNTVSKPAYGQKFTWTPTALGTDQNNAAQWSVYPNPAHESVHIQGLPTKEFDYTIYDMSGRIIQYDHTQNTHIDLQQIETGNYLLAISANSKTTTYKLVKM